VRERERAQENFSRSSEQIKRKEREEIANNVHGGARSSVAGASIGLCEEHLARPYCRIFLRVVLPASEQ